MVSRTCRQGPHHPSGGPSLRSAHVQQTAYRLHRINLQGE